MANSKLCFVCVLGAMMISLGLAAAQDIQTVEGPLMGFAMDRTEGVRPLYGIPGAATLGRSVLQTHGLNNVLLGPQARYALAISNDRRVVLLKKQDTSYAAFPVDIEPGASRIALSPSGSSAVFFYGDSRRLALISGLPDSASVSGWLTLPDFAGDLAALAVNDKADVVLAVAEGEQNPLILLAPGSNYRLLFSILGSPGISFLPDSPDAVVLDGALGTVQLVRDLKGEPKSTVIGGPSEGISHPVAVAVSADRKRAFVANAEPGGVVALSLSGAEASLVQCNCAPALLEPIGENSAFRLNDAGNGPLWVLDAEASPPRIVFVPDREKRPQPTGRGLVNQPRN